MDAITEFLERRPRSQRELRSLDVYGGNA